MIPYGKQEIVQQDIDAVIEVLQSDFLTQGPKVPQFEEALKAYTGAGHAVVVNSATSALHIACLSLGLERGDWLWTSPITFVASANCGLYCGASVDFVDIDPKTYNISVEALSSKLITAQEENRLPKVIVVVHMTGQSCDMAALQNLAKQYGFFIIEDASHAIGGKYLDRRIGCSEYSDITVFSFHPVKIVTSAEGGAALTNDDGLARKMSLYRSHGITRDPELITCEVHGAWYYEQLALGFNYRMTELQAALGISQLERVDDFISKRHSLASRYDELLGDLPVTVPWQSRDSYSSFHLYVIRLNLQEIGKSKRMIFDELRANGIGVNVHYIPVHTQPYFRKLNHDYGELPEAESYYQEAITLPLFHTMTNRQQDRCVTELRNVIYSIK